MRDGHQDKNDDFESDISGQPNLTHFHITQDVFFGKQVAICSDMFRFRLLIDRFCAWRRPEDQVEAWNRVAADEALRQAVEDAERAAHIAEVKRILQTIATQQNAHASEANRQRERPVRHPLPGEPKPDVKDRVVIRL